MINFKKSTQGSENQVVQKGHKEKPQSCSQLCSRSEHLQLLLSLYFGIFTYIPLNNMLIVLTVFLALSN